MKRKLLSVFLSAALLIGCLPMTAIADTGVAINEANFPDSVFRDYISRKFDTVKDGVLSATEIANATKIDISSCDELTSLVGIKNFTNLKTLYCYNYYTENLKSLDVSGMTSLEYLDCAPSGVTSLNVTGCTNLKYLYCYQADITSLDVSSCTNLIDLDCSCCCLTSLNVSGCMKLEQLTCADNNLSSLDLRGLSELYALVTVANPMKNIYIGDSPSLCESYLATCGRSTYPYYRKDGSCEYFDYSSELYVDVTDTVYGCTQRTPDPMPSLPSPSKSVGDFVTRCYEVALGRSPDATGFNNYMNNLIAGKACGGQVAHNFIFSQEYINKNKSNEAFVDDLYQMFFDRSRGSGEGQSWINELDAGVKNREQVFNGFVNSQEFFNLCKDYGITAGYYVSGVASSKQGGVNCFVERLYEVCLGRRSDIGGQKTWAAGLMAGTVTGSSCVHGFLFSAEFTNKNLNDLDFVAYTYRAFFGREADAEGLKTWMNYLGNGGTREGVFNGFVNSQEFKNLCSSYGINP